MLTTYEMISRELDAIYIYIPETVYADSKGLHFMTGSSDEYMLNQLYVLMTRGKGSINIFCENESVYKYLTERYNHLVKESKENNFLTKEERIKSKKIEEQIYERGITRLIHFTAVDNLNYIYI